MNLKIRETKENYSKMLYKEALKTGFFELQTAKDKYLQLSALDAINWPLILRFIELQITLLSPICPHVAEHVWTLIGKVSFRICSATISQELDRKFERHKIQQC